MLLLTSPLATDAIHQHQHYIIFTAALCSRIITLIDPTGLCYPFFIKLITQSCRYTVTFKVGRLIIKKHLVKNLQEPGFSNDLGIIQWDEHVLPKDGVATKLALEIERKSWKS